MNPKAHDNAGAVNQNTIVKSLIFKCKILVRSVLALLKLWAVNLSAF